MGPRTINVFARFPRRGAVKTRLAASVGEHRALALHRAMARHAIAVAGRVSDARRVVWTAGPRSSSLFAGVPVRELRRQPPGDLGLRMRHALDAHLREGRPGIVIGTDCPALDPTRLEAALAALTAHDVVLGPATDGGYYLIGLSRRAPGLFRGVAWGSHGVLASTLVRVRQAGLSLAMLEPLTDIDEAADLHALPDPLRIMV